MVTYFLTQAQVNTVEYPLHFLHMYLRHLNMSKPGVHGAKNERKDIFKKYDVLR